MNCEKDMTIENDFVGDCFFYYGVNNGSDCYGIQIGLLVVRFNSMLYSTAASQNQIHKAVQVDIHLQFFLIQTSFHFLSCLSRLL